MIRIIFPLAKFVVFNRESENRKPRTENRNLGSREPILCVPAIPRLKSWAITTASRRGGFQTALTKPAANDQTPDTRHRFSAFAFICLISCLCCECFLLLLLLCCYFKFQVLRFKFQVLPLPSLLFLLLLLLVSRFPILDSRS